MAARSIFSIFFSFFYFLFNDPSSAQDADTTLANMSYDSIQKEEALKKANYYISKANSFYYQSPDSAIFYYEKASVVYEKLNNWKSYIDCYINIGDFFRVK